MKQFEVDLSNIIVKVKGGDNIDVTEENNNAEVSLNKEPIVETLVVEGDSQRAYGSSVLPEYAQKTYTGETHETGIYNFGNSIGGKGGGVLVVGGNSNFVTSAGKESIQSSELTRTYFTRITPGAITFAGDVSYRALGTAMNTRSFYISSYRAIGDSTYEYFNHVNGLSNVTFNPETASKYNSSGTKYVYPGDTTKTGAYAATEHQVWEVWNELTEKITALEARVAALENNNP